MGGEREEVPMEDIIPFQPLTEGSDHSPETNSDHNVIEGPMQLMMQQQQRALENANANNIGGVESRFLVNPLQTSSDVPMQLMMQQQRALENANANNIGGVETCFLVNPLQTNSDRNVIDVPMQLMMQQQRAIENMNANNIGGVGTFLFVGDLEWWTTDAEVEAELVKYGQVKEVIFFEEKASGKFRGYCQVEFCDESAAKACKEGMNGHVFNGRPCVVTYASPFSLIRRMGNSSWATRIY